MSLHKDVRQHCAACEECATLNARRNKAHRHYRNKTYRRPRTAYAMDWYPSTNGYCQLLGAVDLATGEIRLMPAKTTAELLLHNVYLRDGIPLSLHSDAAREFLAPAVQSISDLLGCKRTTTLAHHPTGNAHIERVWQFVGKCLRQMRDTEYNTWERHVRLMEFTYNTTVHSTVGAAPFTIAHGMPARTIVGSTVAEDLQRDPEEVNTDEVAIIKTSATAFANHAANLREQQQRASAQRLNQGGKQTQLRVGDRVSFYLPPTAAQAKRRGRKVKHLQWYRGPATITKPLSGTTFELSYQGGLYKRAIQEVRPWRGNRVGARNNAEPERVPDEASIASIPGGEAAKFTKARAVRGLPHGSNRSPIPRRTSSGPPRGRATGAHTRNIHQASGQRGVGTGL